MGAKLGRTTDKTELGEQPAYSLTEAARYLKLAPTDPPILPPLEYNPRAANLAWKRTMEFFDQRLRK